jgi:hypothetical protein
VRHPLVAALIRAYDRRDRIRSGVADATPGSGTAAPAVAESTRDDAAAVVTG